jgi:glycosyltransferase involved in cell wall biosynthesis
MKVLMISSNRNVATPGSLVAERMKEYGSLVEELHIVLLSNASHGLREAQIGKNVWVYPTNSATSFLRPLGAASLGKKLIIEKKFVRGRSVITGDSIECGWAGMKIKNKWRLPLEVQLHTDPFSPYFSGFQNRVRKYFARQVLRSADSLRVVSHAVAEKLGSFTQAPITVLPIYIDRERIEKANISFDAHARYGWQFVLLSVARLAPEKNLGLALKILSLVRQKFPDTGLVIVGTGPDKSHLMTLVKKLKLEGFVEFAGWQNELGSFYKTSNVFIQTSRFEGYGLALVEAGLSGLPVVTTPVGIAQEFKDGKEIYLVPQDGPEIAAARIIDLMENNQKRENLRFNFKNTLEAKLIPKDEYLKRLIGNWEITAQKVG